MLIAVHENTVDVNEPLGSTENKQNQESASRFQRNFCVSICKFRLAECKTHVLCLFTRKVVKAHLATRYRVRKRLCRPQMIWSFLLCFKDPKCSQCIALKVGCILRFHFTSPRASDIIELVLFAKYIAPLFLCIQKSLQEIEGESVLPCLSSFAAHRTFSISFTIATWEKKETRNNLAVDTKNAKDVKFPERSSPLGRGLKWLAQLLT